MLPRHMVWVCVLKRERICDRVAYKRGRRTGRRLRTAFERVSVNTLAPKIVIKSGEKFLVKKIGIHGVLLKLIFSERIRLERIFNVILKTNNLQIFKYFTKEWKNI